MLRVVSREYPKFDSSKPKEPEDDPRVLQLLKRYTIGSAAVGHLIFSSGDTELLRLGLRGISFTDEDLAAIGAWLQGRQPFAGKRPVHEELHELNLFVEEELRRVSRPQWLEEPLNAFMRMIEDSKKNYSVLFFSREIVRAAFTAFLTIRA
ncbi:hypothetical protein HZA87_02500 [Candidatus Uhrbacteria bacterium]|nr:hypothetical protein [Candidatus Uhrbacteria bacterium]